jgi:hypothetical protein
MEIFLCSFFQKSEPALLLLKLAILAVMFPEIEKLLPLPN